MKRFIERVRRCLTDMAWAVVIRIIIVCARVGSLLDKIFGSA